MTNKRTIIIIPAHNEAKNINKIVSDISDLYPTFDILVINDASTDNTSLEVKKTKALLISHPFNLGYGVSIQTGYKYAFENDYDYLIQLDGDGQHDVASIADLHHELLHCSGDLILGTRFNPKSNFYSTFCRRIGIKLFRFIVNFITKLEITDVTTGFQGMNRKVFKEFIGDTFPFDYPDADVIVMANRNGIKIREVPVTMHQDNTGQSMHSNPFKNFLYIIQMFISLSLLLLKRK